MKQSAKASSGTAMCTTDIEPKGGKLGGWGVLEGESGPQRVGERPLDSTHNDSFRDMDAAQACSSGQDRRRQNRDRIHIHVVETNFEYYKLCGQRLPEQ